MCNSLLADSGGDPAAIREEHHVVPQAYGGKDGPVIPLCISHHDLAHLIATKKISQQEYSHLMPASRFFSSRLGYLSSVIEYAHSLTEKDPNKRVTISVTMSKSDLPAVDSLCSMYRVGRSELLRVLLKKELARTLPGLKL